MGLGHFAVILALAVGALLSGDARAEEPAPAVRSLAVGDSLPALGLRDQHGAEAHIGPDTALVLFTRDMDGGGFVKEALAEDGATKLSAAKAAYVSDVSGMPGPIRSMFALPSIRKRPYRVVLDETGTATASMPYQEGAVTVLSLENGKIVSASFVTSLEALRARLEPPAAP